MGQRKVLTVHTFSVLSCFIIICQSIQQRTIMDRTQGSHTDKNIIRPFEIFFFLFKTTAVMKTTLVRREVQKMIQVKTRNPLLTYNASVVKSIASATYLFK